MTLLRLIVASCILALSAPLLAEWKLGNGPLITKWGKEVRPDKVHQEYPRPQMVRKEWVNLNGLWDYAVVKKRDMAPLAEEGIKPPEKWEGEILVPFPIESALSGVMKRVGPEEVLWYRRSFDRPKLAEKGRLLLHFGAVDWHTQIFVNGKEVGRHTGGYDPFTLDITAALKPEGKQELTVVVVDPTDASFQPRGKQIGRPHGIWYTPTTGIWQTVWLEPVPETYVSRLWATADLDQRLVRLAHAVAKGEGTVLKAVVMDGPIAVAEATAAPGEPLSIPVPDPKLWSPGSPHLYKLSIGLLRNGNLLDEVESYFAMRKISLGPGKDGKTRLLLNNEDLFQYGPLDQGFWPDGLYTAPSDEALKYDIEITKELGFNMIRKHVKVEPSRWYYHCDKLGMLVWQDMPSGDRYIGANQPDIVRSPESAKNFEHEWHEIVTDFGNHPSIVMWVPFNEGWGQYDTARIAKLTSTWDPTRLVNSVSGWADRKVGDVHDWHIYPGPGMPPTEEHRAAVLGEFGGLGLPLEGHTWQAKDNWGYRSYKTKEELEAAYIQAVGRLRPLIGQGLSAAVYTQTTDVEIEVNGLLTYDRAVLKVDLEKAAAAARRLHLLPPTVTTLIPTGQRADQIWKYTTAKPADGWEKPVFDDAKWMTGPGGFGTEGTPGTQVRTEWKTPDIWVRRTVKLADQMPTHLMLHHDEDAEVYLNGVLAAKVTGYTTEYILIEISDKALAVLKPGENSIAIHCKQTGGGQYIDAGLVRLVEKEK